MNSTLDVPVSIQSPAVIKPRDPKIASLLAKTCPGLGHVYAGDIRRGLTILAIVDLSLALGAFFLVVHWGSAWLALAMWIVAAVVAGVSVRDCSKTVLRTRADYRMKDYNHWIAYIVIGVVPSLATTIAVSLAIFTTVSQSIVATSPLPQLDIRTGDRFIEWKKAYRENKPVVGDYICYRESLGKPELYMGRIVALPGAPVVTAEGRTLVPEGSLGLERADASRNQLVISEMAVTGKLLYRYWPAPRIGSLESKP